jgi:Na+/melibiose symporter-like transporter
MVINTHTYYMPIYFQTVLNTSATEAGIRALSYGITSTLATVGSGLLITKLGYYVPFMWVGAIVLTVGSGLLYTLQVDSTATQWVTYPIVTGMGFGISTQVPILAASNVLRAEDIPTGNGIVMFFQATGATLGVCIAQNVFAGTLLEQLSQIPGIDAAAVIAHGASHVSEVVPPSLLRSVLFTYDHAIQHTFLVPICAAAMAFVASLGMEWRKMGDKRGKSQERHGDGNE